MVEQRTFNPMVEGSIPSTPTSALIAIDVPGGFAAFIICWGRWAHNAFGALADLTS